MDTSTRAWLSLQFMFEHGLSSSLLDCCSIVAATGSLESLRYLHQHGCAVSQGTCSAAARGGHISCLKYLHEQGCAWDEKTCEYSAANGHTECLLYAIQHGCKWNNFAANAAAENGHVHIVALLCKLWGASVPWLGDVADHAVWGGHLAVLQYLHSIGHPITDEFVIVRATQFGHLHCLKYLHEQGSPLTTSVSGMASLCGHLDCLKYVVEHGCPVDDHAYEVAATEEIKVFIGTLGFYV